MFKKDSVLLYSFGGVAFILTGLIFWNYFTPEWKDYQSEFKDMVEQKFGAQRVAQVPTGLQQIWIKDLDRVDRCVTCHQGMQWKGLDNAPQPFKSHPQEILKSHPIEKFGCTACHVWS